MNDTPFHATRMGRTVYERDLPLAIEYLRQIAAELKTLNEHLRSRQEHDDDPA